MNGVPTSNDELVTYTFTTTDTPKTVREALCVAQNAVLRDFEGQGGVGDYSAVLGRLIADCDRQRPLGPDGKHGHRHTDTCGCEDKWLICQHGNKIEPKSTGPCGCMIIDYSLHPCRGCGPSCGNCL